ncbi:MAG: hypothetical protein QOE45_2480 [Frankiaceae bacterium]|nr:hypothetical protein [Frankiaceae bacterium]
MRGLSRASGLVLLLGSVVASAAPAPLPRVVLTGATVDVAAGASAVVPVRARVAALPLRADVMVLLDVSTSMTLPLADVRSQLATAVRRLAADGVDLNVGLALAGSAPRADDLRAGGGTAPHGDPRQADPVTDPNNPSYRSPVLFRRVAPVGPVAAFLPALAAVRPEVLVSTSDSGLVYEREQAQLLGVEQLLTGRGSPGSANDDFQDAVAPGQVAGWRPDAARLVVSVTDQELGSPSGTPTSAAVGAALAAAHVGHVGLVVMGYAGGVTDLARLSAAAGTYVPAGGLRCGGFAGDDVVPGGAPFVCNTTRTASAVETAVRALHPRATLDVRARSADPAFRPLTVTLPLDGTARGLTVGVPVTCPVAATASRHDLPVTARYAGAVATATVTVRCGAAAVAVAPPVVQPPPPAAPGPGVAPPPPAVVPPLPPPPPAPLPGANVQQGSAAQPNAAVRPQDETNEQVAEERTDDAQDPLPWLLAAAALTAAAAAAATRTAPRTRRA